MNNANNDQKKKLCTCGSGLQHKAWTALISRTRVWKRKARLLWKMLSAHCTSTLHLLQSAGQPFGVHSCKEAKTNYPEKRKHQPLWSWAVWRKCVSTSRRYDSICYGIETHDDSNDKALGWRGTWINPTLGSCHVPALECSGGSNIHWDAPFSLTPHFSFTHILNLIQHLLIATDPIVVSHNRAARVFVCVKNSYTWSSCMQSSQVCIQLDNGALIQEGVLFRICKTGRITSPNFLRTLWTWL